MRAAPILMLAALTGPLQACAATPAGAPSSELARYCVSHGYGPMGSGNYEWCLRHYSIAGNKRDLDTRAVGREPGL